MPIQPSNPPVPSQQVEPQPVPDVRRSPLFHLAAGASAAGWPGGG